MKIDNVIIATDMSQTSEAAAKWGMSFAKAIGVEVVLAHVIEVSLGGWLKGTFDILEDTEKLAYAKEKLIKWCVNATGSKPDAVEIRAGGTLHQLKSIAIDWEGKSAIVVAQSRASKVELLFVGSTTQRLAAQPPCPLIIVHPQHSEFHKNTTLVCGTDFSPNAGLAMQFSSEICKRTGSNLVVTHGRQVPIFDSLFDEGPDNIFDLQQSVEEVEKENMDALMDGLKKDGVPAKSVVEEENPGDLIIATVHSEKSDLVVLGHGGESPIAQNILGSVTHRVLGKMPTTLAIIPQGDI